MLRILLAMALAVASSASATTQQIDQVALVARAQEVVARLVSGDVQPLLHTLTEKMQAAVDANGLQRLIPSLVAQVGPFQSQIVARFESQGVMRVVLVSCEFERATVEIRVAFDPLDRLAGIGFLPPKPTVAYVAPPYVTVSAFRDEAITIDAGGWPLPGTLTLPIGEGPFPGVVLVHGSGPNDRDESIGPNKPFRDLAEGLASRGIAVLRYDKRTRTHANRIGGLRDFTVRDEVIDDAVAAVRNLRETPSVRVDRVFLLGHSLGGMLAPRIAAAEPSIAGLILLAAATKPLEQAIVEQTRYLAMLDGKVSADEETAIAAVTKLAADVRALKASDPPIVSTGISAPASYWLDLRGYDPPAAARGLKQPMLVLQGERDYQVTMEDQAAWQRAIGSRANVQITSYPALNHLFLAGSRPSAPAEYGQAGHVDEAVVRDIAAWIMRENR
ncbi:MAG: alpha/beta fold hydrolase [Vicinamibacterales bacterium]